MTWSESIFCEPKYTRHVQKNWLAPFVKANFVIALSVGLMWLAAIRVLASDHIAARLLIVLTSPHRYRSPVDRLPASRLPPPRSGLSRSDFVLWHTAAPPSFAGESGYRGGPDAPATRPEWPLVTLKRHGDARLLQRKRGHYPISLVAGSCFDRDPVAN